MIKKFKSFLITERSSDIKYGCLMMYFDVSRYEFYNLISNEIDSEDIDEYGLENEPHITILYGLHKNIKCEDLKKYTIDTEKVDIKWGDLSLFENEYDVLKISLESDELSEMNSLVRDNFKYTSDFPDYKPHLTIGYIKSGKGKKYLSKEFKESVLKLLDNSRKYYVYSTVDGVKSLWL